MSNLIFDRVLEKLQYNKSLREGGQYVGIPYPFPRLSEYLPCIEKGHSIGILGATGGGKSKFTRYTFLYHVYKFYKQTGYKVKILFFPLEDAKEKVYLNLIGNYLADQRGIIASPQELKSQRGTLASWLEEEIINARSYFKELEDVVSFYDDIFTPKEIYERCRAFAMTIGKPMKRIKADGTEEGFYKPNDDTHVIVILDNMSNLDADPEDGCNSEREAMVKMCKDYIRARLCNKFNFTVVQVIQMSFDKERQQYTHSGQSIVSKLEPSLDGVGDAKTITRSMHLVMGLFNPSRYDLVAYPTPPKEHPTACYRIDILGNRFRALKILKSNDSDVGMRIGMNFNALAETFEELPLPQTRELDDIYKDLTSKAGKAFVPLTTGSHKELAPKADADEQDELPF